MRILRRIKAFFIRKQPYGGSRYAAILLSSLALGVGICWYVIVPLQGQMGLNLVAIAEPYFRWTYHYRILQVFIVFGARYLFFPFFILLGFLIARFAITKTLVRVERFLKARSAKAGAASADEPVADESDEEDDSAQAVESDAARQAAPETEAAGASVFDRIDAWFAGVFSGPVNFAKAVREKTPNLIFKPVRFVFMIPVRVLQFILVFYLAFASLTFGIEGIGFVKMAAAGITHFDGMRAFGKNCSKCHGFNRPYNFNHSAEIWEITVDRMYRHADDMDKELPKEIRDDVVGFLQAIRSYSDSRLVSSKCYICHTAFSDIFDTKRTPDEWELLTDRIHRQNSFHITVRQRDQLVDYFQSDEDLVRDKSDGFFNYDQKMVFERKCSVCHTLDIIYMPHIKKRDWKTILTRMGKKEPDFLSEEESLSTYPLIKKALRSPDKFHGYFPHSTMWEKDAPLAKLIDDE